MKSLSKAGGVIGLFLSLSAVTGTLTYGETARDAVFAGKMKNGAGEEVDGCRPC